MAVDPDLQGGSVRPAHRPLGHYAEPDLPADPPNSERRPLVLRAEESDDDGPDDAVRRGRDEVRW